MSGFITAEGLVIPIGSDTYDYTGDQKRLSSSIRSIVPIATQAAGDTVATNMASDGRAVSDTNPLIGWNAALQALMVKGANGWSPADGRFIRYAEFTSAAVAQSSGAGVNFGTMTADASFQFNNTFTVGQANGIKFTEAGVYLFEIIGFTNATSGTNTHLWGIRSSDSAVLLSVNHLNYGSNTVTGTIIMYGAVNDIMTCGITQGANTTVNSRVKVFKLAG